MYLVSELPVSQVTDTAEFGAGIPEFESRACTLRLFF